jgi:hypothetical protein
MAATYRRPVQVGDVFKERDYRIERWVRVIGIEQADAPGLQDVFVVQSVVQQGDKWVPMNAVRSTRIRKDRLQPRFWEAVDMPKLYSEIAKETRRVPLPDLTQEVLLGAVRTAAEELRECRTFIRDETGHMPTVLHLDEVIGALEKLLPEPDDEDDDCRRCGEIARSCVYRRYAHEDRCCADCTHVPSR